MEQIKAKVVAHSKSSVSGKEVITFELEFPRIILAEFNTHNALSKNSSSSRAIPVDKMLQQVRDNPAMPVRFGKANKGMQDAGEHEDLVIVSDEMAESWGGLYPKDAWKFAANRAADLAQAFHEAGYAKQICNRLIEPFQMMKVVMTATELNNFIWLRDHPAADPTIEALAKAIKKVKDESEPFVLHPGEWHVPYIGRTRDCLGNIMYLNGELPPFSNKTQVLPTISLEDALTISMSCTAQVSFRSLDDTLEKAKSVVNKLNLAGEDLDNPSHASPSEHQCTPIKESENLLQMMPRPDNFDACAMTYKVGKINVLSNPETWQEGITHMDRDGTLCSGNLKGFIQYRQLIPNNVKKG